MVKPKIGRRVLFDLVTNKNKKVIVFNGFLKNVFTDGLVLRCTIGVISVSVKVGVRDVGRLV